jgi:Bromodomain
VDVSEHPLPTPPSIPPDTYDRVLSPSRQVEDPHSASPGLAGADSFISGVHDQPPSLTTQSPPIQQHKADVPQAESSMQLDRLHPEPTTAMDVDENPLTNEMVNGHKDGEYISKITASGPTVESPEPTNQPIPPPIDRSIAARAQTTPSTLATPLHPPSQSLPTPREPGQPVISNPPIGTDVTMQDAQPVITPNKPIRQPPSTSDEPPAKRLKTEASTLSNETSKKIPANQQKFLMALLRQVKKSKDATPFREPVDPIKLNIPRYFDVVDRPMDISTIEKKLNSGAYSSAQAVVEDFNLMIDNCVKFNGLENPVTKMGKNIQATFEKGMKTLPPEQVLVFFRLGGNSDDTRYHSHRNQSRQSYLPVSSLHLNRKVLHQYEKHQLGFPQYGERVSLRTVDRNEKSSLLLSVIFQWTNRDFGKNMPLSFDFV